MTENGRSSALCSALDAMVESWNIKFPSPIFPVSPGEALHDRKQPPRRPRKQPVKKPETEQPQDDDQHHIDDYA